MINLDRKIRLVTSIGRLVERHDMSPDDAFNRVADQACISGKDRKKLRNAWKKSLWFENWAEKNKDLVPHLVW